MNFERQLQKKARLRHNYTAPPQPAYGSGLSCIHGMAIWAHPPHFATVHWPFSKLRPLMRTGQLERSICQLWLGSDNYTAVLHWNSCYHFRLVIFRLVLWILSLPWFNTVSRALLKTFFTFPKWNAEKCNIMLCAKLFRRPHSPLNNSQFNKHSCICFGKHWSHLTLLIVDITRLIWDTYGH